LNLSENIFITGMFSLLFDMGEVAANVVNGIFDPRAREIYEAVNQKYTSANFGQKSNDNTTDTNTDTMPKNK
jgi:hypothetical protein